MRLASHDLATPEVGPSRHLLRSHKGGGRYRGKTDIADDVWGVSSGNLCDVCLWHFSDIPRCPS
jgi:hypothetical protein